MYNGGSVNFDRTWEEYKQGFGDPSGEFWIGNERLHQLTSEGYKELRILVTDSNDVKFYPVYSNFSVGNEASKYALTLAGHRSDPEGNHKQYFISYEYSYHSFKVRLRKLGAVLQCSCKTLLFLLSCNMLLIIIHQ